MDGRAVERSASQPRHRHRSAPDEAARGALTVPQSARGGPAGDGDGAVVAVVDEVPVVVGPKRAGRVPVAGRTGSPLVARERVVVG